MHGSAERRVLKLAADQHALIARWQALDLGMSASDVRKKVANGSWVVVRRGLYEVAGCPRTWQRSVLERVLSAGRNAVASHVTACGVHGLLRIDLSIVHVTVHQSRHPEPITGRRLHRSRELSSSDVTRIDGIPVTSVPRTLLDVAGVLPDEQLEAALDGALTSGKTSIGAMRRYLRARSRRWNVKRLIRLLDDRELGVPESELERAFERLIKSERLPMPARQQPVSRYRVDYAYVERNIVIEVDGSATRSTRAQLQRDRRRQNEIVLEERLILRFTWDDVTRDVPYVTATINRALGRAGGGS